LHHHLPADQLADVISWVLENVTLSYEDPELAACLRHWERLLRTSPQPRFSPEWSLHAKSVVDRIGRALADWTDRLYQLLQPKAEFLGQAFNAESWTITLFSEEVVRGSSLGFALSMLLHHVGRVLRQAANLGTWQIVSRGRGTGQVEAVQELREVQGRSLQQSTVIIADKVRGDEELPKEVVAVIAPDVTDLVSHVAVRARNAAVLFASCSDASVLQQLKSLRGRVLYVEVTPAGDVTFKEVAHGEAAPESKPGKPVRITRQRPHFTKFAVSVDEFNEQIVGAKSISQARLRKKLPDWVRQPASLALPFGCMEQVLSLKENQAKTARYNELVRQLKENAKLEPLGELRQTIESLSAPEELKQALRDAAGRTGICWPENWEAAWKAIKRVWASKWNERALLSRQRVGIGHEDLFMSVLIQPVVEADYAFVIHTVNPSTSNRDELYAEIVLGLGETLVGNYPGRALSFLWDKQSEQTRLMSYPSKSIALHGGALIFRSDSNGEDLAGYAGAGLYDSVTLNPARQIQLDYSEEPLLWDEPFRNGLLLAVARIGLAIEKTLGTPQDIEGAVAKGEYFVVQTRPQVGVNTEQET
jgi:alpha-glucan,water dikinase